MMFDVQGPEIVENSSRVDAQIAEAEDVMLRMVRALVDNPEEAQITIIRGSSTIVFEVRVAAIDVKRIIGRKGRTADALRELLVNMGGKAGRRYLLEIIEPVRRYVEPEERNRATVVIRKVT